MTDKNDGIRTADPHSIRTGVPILELGVTSLQPSRWADLTPDEQDMLRKLNRGATVLMIDTQVEHMIARGLAERRSSGPGLSPLGRDIMTRMVAEGKKQA